MCRPTLVASLLIGMFAGTTAGQTCDTELLSRTPGGFAGNGQTVAEDISDDGRFVVLNTQATDLFNWTSDGNSFTSFLAGQDRLSGNTFAYQGNIFYYGGDALIVDPITARISNDNAVVFDTLRDYTGNKFRGVYQSGNRIADQNGYSDVYVRSLDIGGVSRVSVGYLGDDADGPSSAPDTDAEGYYIVFQTDASNIVPGDTNGVTDVMLSSAGYPSVMPVIISVGLNGAPANGASTSPVISADGGTVAFRSLATNLVAGDTNGVEDVFVVDSVSYPAVERVSVGPGGVQANGRAGRCSLSADGMIVCFSSVATNLVTGDSNGFQDIFVHYRGYGLTRRVSVSTSGEEADRGSYLPGISANGRYVIFTSNATNLVADDTNGAPDAFVHDLWSGRTSRVSLNRAGAQLNGESSALHADESGRDVLFTSYADDSGWTDSNASRDAFLRDRACDIEPFCDADFNLDQIVDTRDFIAYLNAWTGHDPRADFDGNFLFNTRDFIAFLNAWADGCS